MSQREPESELESLKVGLRVTLGPNLRCQSQPRQSELENRDFPEVFLRFLSETVILRCVFEGGSHQVLENTRISERAWRRTEPRDPPLALRRNR